ncbi:hypothetical protein MF672_021600 [Actinomadura sp. ATCC 31491]|uniref:Golvesin/Xly CBD-like domain-containing protein n=1 Tax=Actinomadura luzonensis TaxID=2805427 RepID=A0ABT0FWQ5_9ACTN|nr:hypothetical protein [Actinomadura luzonensis]MCK2216375.1 hypothetical protein [Actinomadura luzonensis]
MAHVPPSRQANWIDAKGTVLRTDAVSTDLNQGEWTPVKVTATAPPNAVIAQIRFVIAGTPSTATVLYLDQVRLVEGSADVTAPARTVTFTHDLNHRVTSAEDAVGHDTVTEYDLDGLITGQTDQEGNKVLFTLDQRGDQVEAKVPHSETDGQVKYTVSQFVFDQVGNKIKAISPRGVDTTDDPTDFLQEIKYDKLNRPIEEIYPFDKDDPVYNQPESVRYAYDAVSRLTEISHPPSHGQTVRNVSRMTYWDNGWSKTTTDPWDIKTTYDYNELGLQTNRTVTSAGGSSQRALGRDYYPDGKVKTHSDDGVPLGLDVVMNDNSDTGQVTVTGSWTATSGSIPSSDVVGPQTTPTGGFVGYDYAIASVGTGAGSFSWNLTIPADGIYKVQVNYPSGATATNAKYTVKHDGSSSRRTVTTG